MAYTQKGMEFKTDPPVKKKLTPPVIAKSVAAPLSKKKKKSYTQEYKKLYPNYGSDGPVKGPAIPQV